MRVVDNERELQSVAHSLEAAPILYIDTEFDSNRDGKTLCLIQIGDGKNVHLIDALRLSVLDSLRPIANPEREWVFHAGLQDLELLRERLRIGEPPKIFDTQVAWALSSAEASVSLAYLKFRLLGIRSGKPHQTDDWRRRPLPASQLAYASSDVEQLPALHAKLGDRLRERGRESLVHRASLEACWPVKEEPEALSLDSFRNAWQLDPACQAALRYLVGWFNALSPAQRAEAPEAKTLFSIAGRVPEHREELARIKGVPRRFANAHGDQLTGALIRATAEARAEDFVPIDPPPYATFEDIRLDGWLAHARAEVCAELGVAPELAFPSRITRRLRALIAETRDATKAIDALEGWRRELAQKSLERFVERTRPDWTAALASKAQ